MPQHKDDTTTVAKSHEVLHKLGAMQNWRHLMQYRGSVSCLGACHRGPVACVLGYSIYGAHFQHTALPNLLQIIDPTS